MSREKVIGRSVPRVESVEKVTGRAVYAVDVSFPNMLWGKVLRSPIAYGRIKRIDVTKALALPGVKAVVTGLDVAGVKIGRQIYDMPVLADGVVRFAGEKVAAVAADSEEIAERALERIDIEYEELSLAEAAAIVGAEVGTVKSRLHRARRRLRRALSFYFKSYGGVASAEKVCK